MSRWLLSTSLVLSTGLHAAAQYGLSGVHALPHAPSAPTLVTFEVAPEPALEPEPAPEPGRSAAESSSAQPSPSAVIPSEPDAPLPQKEAPMDNETEAPADLTGLTLTGDGTGTWQSAVGSGKGNGLVRSGRRAKPAPGARPTVGHRPTVGSSKPVAPRVVALSDLSRRPAPPNLGSALQANYPPDARAQGRGGHSRVRARIDADGVVRYAEVVSASLPQFGQACRSTVLGSRWSPPLDRDGHPVATFITYDCTFRVQ